MVQKEMASLSFISIDFYSYYFWFDLIDFGI